MVQMTLWLRVLRASGRGGEGRGGEGRGGGEEEGRSQSRSDVDKRHGSLLKGNCKICQGRPSHQVHTHPLSYSYITSSHTHTHTSSSGHLAHKGRRAGPRQ